MRPAAVSRDSQSARPRSRRVVKPVDFYSARLSESLSERVKKFVPDAIVELRGARSNDCGSSVNNRATFTSVFSELNRSEIVDGNPRVDS